MSPRVRGLVLRCHLDGRVVEVVRDDFDPDRTSAATTFVELLDPGSASKGISFLHALSRDEVAYEWELDLHHNGRHRLRFVGLREGDTLVVIGTSEPGDMESFITELSGVQNALVNRLRDVMRPRESEPEFDELTQLNNELTNLQRELARKNSELARLDDRKNHLLGMAAHDLRSPLASVQGFAETLLILATDRLEEREVAMLQRIMDSSMRMNTLIGDLLSVSEIESGQLTLRPEDFDLAAHLHETVDLLRSAAERKGVQLTVATPDELPVHADPDKLGQVVDNLVTNAIKFSHPDTEVAIALAADGDSYRIEIADHGQGIPYEEHDKLFTAFGKTSVRATAGEGSTGLGLLIVKTIVEGHGGTITVDSTVGEGSTFTVTLPLRPAS